MVHKFSCENAQWIREALFSGCNAWLITAVRGMAVQHFVD